MRFLGKSYIKRFRGTISVIISNKIGPGSHSSMTLSRENGAALQGILKKLKDYNPLH